MPYKVIAVHTDLADSREFLEGMLNAAGMEEYRIVGIIQPTYDGPEGTSNPAFVVLYSEPMYPVGGMMPAGRIPER